MDGIKRRRVKKLSQLRSLQQQQHQLQNVENVGGNIAIDDGHSHLLSSVIKPDLESIKSLSRVEHRLQSPPQRPHRPGAPFKVQHDKPIPSQWNLLAKIDVCQKIPSRNLLAHSDSDSCDDDETNDPMEEYDIDTNISSIPSAAVVPSFDHSLVSSSDQPLVSSFSSPSDKPSTSPIIFNAFEKAKHLLSQRMSSSAHIASSTFRQAHEPQSYKHEGPGLMIWHATSYPLLSP